MLNFSNFFKFLFAFLFLYAFSSVDSKAQDASSSDQIFGINSLMSAAASNDVEGVKFLSRANKLSVNQKNVGGATALHIACRQKSFEVAKILIENGANVNFADNEGWTPLMRAALAGDSMIVDLLLDNGAQANQLNSINESAIIHATSSDCDKCLSSIFSKFDFAKFMNPELLKTQLLEAFVIAQNRDNQPNQKIIEEQLTKLLKATEELEKLKAAEEAKKQAEEKQQQEAKTVFKFTPSEQSTDEAKSVDQMPKEEKPSEAPYVSILEEKAINQPGVSQEQSQTPQVVKIEPRKFRFIAGEPAKSRKEMLKEKFRLKKEQEEQKKNEILRVKEAADVVKKEDKKLEEGAVIDLSDKPLQNSSEADSKIKKLGEKKFKFNKGEQGKTIKEWKEEASKTEELKKESNAASSQEDSALRKTNDVSQSGDIVIDLSDKKPQKFKLASPRK